MIQTLESVSGAAWAQARPPDKVQGEPTVQGEPEARMVPDMFRVIDVQPDPAGLNACCKSAGWAFHPREELFLPLWEFGNSYSEKKQMSKLLKCNTHRLFSLPLPGLTNGFLRTHSDHVHLVKYFKIIYRIRILTSSSDSFWVFSQ